MGNFLRQAFTFLGLAFIFLAIVVVLSACGQEPGDDTQTPQITINNYHVQDQGVLDDSDSVVDDDSHNEDNDDTNTETYNYDDDMTVGGDYTEQK